ncbi:MAG: CTP synthetase [Rhodobacterales bacterium]|nr:MAG: CTP synthetase [Rhodobacterales bacterium]
MGLFLLVYIFLGATMAGSAMVAALTMGFTTMQPIMYSSIAGFIVAIPFSWIIAKKLRELN